MSTSLPPLEETISIRPYQTLLLKQLMKVELHDKAWVCNQFADMERADAERLAYAMLLLVMGDYE